MSNEFNHGNDDDYEELGQREVQVSICPRDWRELSKQQFFCAACASTLMSGACLTALDLNLPPEPTNNFYEFQDYLVLLQLKTMVFLSGYTCIVQGLYICLRSCRNKQYIVVTAILPVGLTCAFLFCICAVLLPFCDLVHLDGNTSR